MNKVLSRPLFRQAGGPILPPNPGLNAPPANPVPMPPAMPPQMGPAMPPQMGPEMPPVAMSPEQAGEAAGAEMEQVGAEYLSGVFSGIDSAETAEDLINALRGDDRPIQSRYQELAMIVGPEDASNTPDSVLALAQPGIMMAMPEVDSGVGMLVEDLASGAEMVTPEGAPTDMGQGVGGLMMAGAGPMDPGPAPMGGAPMPMGPEMGMAPQRLATGGPVVKKFNTAGAVTSEPETLSFYDPEAAIEAAMAGVSKPIGISQQYNTLLPLYQGLVGSSDDSRKLQGKLALAKAFSDFGSGKYAGKGRSVFSQGLGAVSDTLPTMAALAAQRDKSDQAVKLAALKSASDLETAARTGQITLAGKKLEYGMGGTKEARDIANLSADISDTMRQLKNFGRTKFIGKEIPVVKGLADDLINKKGKKIEGGDAEYVFTGDELAFIDAYMSSFPLEATEGREFVQIIQDLIAKNKISKGRFSNTTQRKIEKAPGQMKDGGEVKKGFPDLTGDGKTTYADILKGRGVELKDGGPVIQNFEEGAEVERPVGTGVSDPGDTTALFGISNILPSIGNYFSGVFGGDLYDTGQRLARNYYREMTSEFNRSRADIKGSLTESDRMSTFREPQLAEVESTTFPREGSLDPRSWIGDEAAYEDIVAKRNAVEERIDTLHNLIQTLGKEEPGITSGDLSKQQIKLKQLISLRNKMDVFLGRMAQQMGGQSTARAMRKRAAEDVNKMMFGDPRSAN